MELRRVRQTFRHREDSTDLVMLSARFALCGYDAEYGNSADTAILAANVNILRRFAPYAYFFATGFDSVQEFDDEDMGFDPGYLRSLQKIVLPKSIELGHPFREYPGSTVIVDIGCLDILPYIFAMRESGFSMLCLPEPRSLQEIISVLSSAPFGPDAAVSLISSGGFLPTLTDDLMSVVTMDDRYERYFQ